MAAPTLSVTALLTLVVLHPLLNFRDLLAFTTWRVTDFAQLAASWMIQQVTDSSLLLQATAYSRRSYPRQESPWLESSGSGSP